MHSMHSISSRNLNDVRYSEITIREGRYCSDTGLHINVSPPYIGEFTTGTTVSRIGEFWGSTACDATAAGSPTAEQRATKLQRRNALTTRDHN